MQNPKKKLRVGDLLVESRKISEVQLQEALAEQKRTGRKLGQVLVDSGIIAEEGILETLSQQLKIPFVDLLHYKFNPEIVRLIPEVQARRFRAIALVRDDKSILVGMSDPTNIFAYDELSRILDRPLRLAVVKESDLLKTIDTVYRKTEQISGFAEKLSTELAKGDIDLRQLVEAADVTDAPVVRMLQSLFEDAVQIGASDIHIEPDEAALRIRQRVDGVLQEHIVNETRIAPALVLRLKLMAGLDISEKRLPQDGRFSVRVNDRNIDVRMSTMPIQHGESAVMRLLDQTGGVRDMDELGMSDQMRARVEALVQRPHGMVLVTGPTGSGKTTTLYAALKLLNTSENKIITVEDPVEYRVPRLNQVQVHSDIGRTFSRVLRSALRHDPDIILIGEMRDEETAEIAIRAAMTGHMVLSTLHTNDALSTVNRLLDMGMKSYLLASALHAIVAQRLVRRICRSCIQPAQLDARETAWVQSRKDVSVDMGAFRRGAGCAHCNHTGYLGRIGVYELLEFHRDLTEVLARGDSADFVRAARAAEGFEPLERVALRYAQEAITTVPEVMRIAVDIDAESALGGNQPALN
ncbi:MAG: type II/IV secretion system protein [Gammaproteobacteria bacterium]|nr:type II/IV secretion system protein [Gammaproteobacteria bacterium]